MFFFHLILLGLPIYFPFVCLSLSFTLSLFLSFAASLFHFLDKNFSIVVSNKKKKMLSNFTIQKFLVNISINVLKKKFFFNLIVFVNFALLLADNWRQQRFEAKFKFLFKFESFANVYTMKFAECYTINFKIQFE